MERMYYALWYRLDTKDRYLIWFTGTQDNLDGVLVASEERIPAFGSTSDLVRYAKANGLTLADVSEPILHNLDVIARWLKVKRRKRGRYVDCKQFLGAWNLFADVSQSIPGNFDPDKDRTQKMYDKLFYGSNLPSLTPEGKHYIPIWSGREMEIMHEILAQGLWLFRNHARPFPWRK